LRIKGEGETTRPYRRQQKKRQQQKGESERFPPGLVLSARGTVLWFLTGESAFSVSFKVKKKEEHKPSLQHRAAATPQSSSLLVKKGKKKSGHRWI